MWPIGSIEADRIAGTLIFIAFSDSGRNRT
jgi:hypothetical protein